MTISVERPAVPADGVEDMVEPYDVRHAVVTVRLAVSRDQLAAAVQLGVGDFYGGERHPDELTADEVRMLVRMNLACMSALELQRAAEGVYMMAESGRAISEDRAYARAAYRAVDRAFPSTR